MLEHRAVTTPADIANVYFAIPTPLVGILTPNTLRRRGRQNRILVALAIGALRCSLVWLNTIGAPKHIQPVPNAVKGSRIDGLLTRLANELFASLGVANRRS
ncbi:hypothetical protein EV359DRAFT_85576 [Lentinula novae-zelandiae]|nr:hypothetical protein EV359DRAFT_85576 [Lentinula novae-zelandiae]